MRIVSIGVYQAFQILGMSFFLPNSFILEEQLMLSTEDKQYKNCGHNILIEIVVSIAAVYTYKIHLLRAPHFVSVM